MDSSRRVLTADYIIVGAGSAGCVLAGRLARDGKFSVMLLEAGLVDGNALIHVPKGYGALLERAPLTWRYQTEPEPGTGMRSEAWIRGRVLGGSSSVNGSLYSRGQAADYDHIAATSGEPAWSWQSMLQVFAEMEDHELGPGEGRGVGGPLKISMNREANALCDAVIDTARAFGIQHREDINGVSDVERVGYFSRTIYAGRRQSAAVAFLHSNRSRKNLTIATGWTVHRILFDGTAAIGVTGQDERGAPFECRAHREVLLCAGGINSPAILQRSGVGPEATLRRASVEPIVASPQVGLNLRENRLIFCQFALRPSSGYLGYNSELQGFPLIKNLFKYLFTRRGPLAGGAFDVGIQIKTMSELERPDAQLMIAPFSITLDGPQRRLEKAPGVQCVAFPLRPESKGHLHIVSAAPEMPPKIVPNYLSAAQDQQTSIRLLRKVRQFFSHPALARYIADETSPGPRYESDGEILEAFGLYGSSCFHAVGTCRMGADTESVLDGRMRVRGVTRLRVVDASSLPQVVTGNTNGPIMAIAWRAAELIRHDALS